MTHHDIANTTQEESTSYFLDRDTMDMTSNYLSSDWWTFKHNSQAWSRSTNKNSYLNPVSISINRVYWDVTFLLIFDCFTSWINKKVVFFSWDSHKIFLFLQLAFKWSLEWNDVWSLIVLIDLTLFCPTVNIYIFYVTFIALILTLMANEKG